MNIIQAVLSILYSLLLLFIVLIFKEVKTVL